ncbi:MAG: Rieske (2Fe-2S) protein [Arachidicoccus sp.]|nr:Rieske (2Fe-2S) protein [Arachidicoccus sp.]
MERRYFLKKACGTCAAMSIGTLLLSSVLESCKTVSLSLYKTGSEKGWATVPLLNFSDTDFKLVRVNNYNFDIAILKQKTGDYDAILLMCTHAGQALTKAGNGYFCTLHGSRFSQSGEVLKGPATDPLQHLPIKIVDQNLLVKLDSNYYSS